MADHVANLPNFLREISAHFQPKIDELISSRKSKKQALDQLHGVQDIIDFCKKDCQNLGSWSIDKLPKRLEKRYIDAGDVSPADLEHLEQCLSTSPDLLTGIQVRFQRFQTHF